MAALPVAVVISGRGSNMEAIARASQAAGAGYEVVRVIADRETALDDVRIFGQPSEDNRASLDDGFAVFFRQRKHERLSALPNDREGRQ